MGIKQAGRTAIKAFRTVYRPPATAIRHVLKTLQRHALQPVTDRQEAVEADFGNLLARLTKLQLQVEHQSFALQPVTERQQFLVAENATQRALLAELQLRLNDQLARCERLLLPLMERQRVLDAEHAALRELTADLKHQLLGQQSKMDVVSEHAGSVEAIARMANDRATTLEEHARHENERYRIRFRARCGSASQGFWPSMGA